MYSSSRNDQSDDSEQTSNFPEDCPKCVGKFTTSHGLKRNQNINDFKTRECHQCGYTLSTNQSLKLHQKSHSLADYKTLECLQCGRKFLTTGNLKRHESTVHALEKSFICIKCDAKFTQKVHLREHELTHAMEDARPHRCSVCHKRFACKRNLTVHEKTHDDRVYPYVCKECGRGFRLVLKVSF